MFSFTKSWKGIVAALGTVAMLLGLGAVLHGGATAYASAADVKALQVRTESIEISQARVVEKLDSLGSKLDLAIDLMAPTRACSR